MPIIKIDLKFCQQMADAYHYPDHVKPRRPEDCASAPMSKRWKAAWLVLTGKADALVWPS